MMPEGAFVEGSQLHIVARQGPKPYFSRRIKSQVFDAPYIAREISFGSYYRANKVRKQWSTDPKFP
jgi:hypothetical protein